MTTNLISIITPSYNSSKFINETIHSVLSQTYPNWELIIVDDNSKDSSAEIISNYIEKDNRIKLIKHQENLGAAQARNTALKHARGRYIAFLDCDDYWEVEKLGLQVKFMQEKHCPISFTEYAVMSEDFSEKYYSIKVPESISYKGYLKNTIIGMSTSMIDTKLVEPFSFYNIRTRQDTYLWITLLKRGHIAFGIPKELTKYRLRKTSISANKIKAAKRVWFLYYNLEKLGFFKSFYYFVHYAYNAVRKRG
jgi:teichuronic acid biosynthesis glycosyltransferase TuaG